MGERKFQWYKKAARKRVSKAPAKASWKVSLSLSRIEYITTKLWLDLNACVEGGCQKMYLFLVIYVA